MPKIHYQTYELDSSKRHDVMIMLWNNLGVNHWALGKITFSFRDHRHESPC
jgi:hypothetical protein